MNWDKLLAFYHTATLGSVKKAAEKLGTSTSSVSRLIDSLEKEIGHELFSVVLQRMAITKKGERFLISVKRLLSQYDLSLKELSEMSQKMEGHYNISATISIIASWIFDDLADFMKAYPQLSLSFTAVDNPPDLTLGEADIDIRSFRRKEEGVEYKYLTTHDMGLYATRDYIQKEGLPERISDFEKHHIFAFQHNLLIPHNAPLNWHLPHITAWKKMTPINSYMGILRAIENGLGIGPVSHAAAKMSRVPLVPILPDILTYPMDLYYMYPKTLSSSRVVAEIYEHLRSRPQGPLNGRIRM
ncbi:LysR family transcriptional regulator [Candidatus Paracaedibacter symbiosus]|uniref:LysR family transcriptional regulator n=1 Tax=Candidatus Paracaedibacter symbiosus TaxID=244582 RepID=UPI0005095979|nr:LysR family transcriptional regulator [Candidatus Paracaedibacter symbiosus]